METKVYVQGIYLGNDPQEQGCRIKEVELESKERPHLQWSWLPLLHQCLILPGPSEEPYGMCCRLFYLWGWGLGWRWSHVFFGFSPLFKSSPESIHSPALLGFVIRVSSRFLMYPTPWFQRSPRSGNKSYTARASWGETLTCCACIQPEEACRNLVVTRATTEKVGLMGYEVMFKRIWFKPLFPFSKVFAPIWSQTMGTSCCIFSCSLGLGTIFGSSTSASIIHSPRHHWQNLTVSAFYHLNCQ